MPDDSNSNSQPLVSTLSFIISACLVLSGLVGGIRLIVWGITMLRAEGLGFWSLLDAVLGVAILINWALHFLGTMYQVREDKEAEAFEAENDSNEAPESHQKVLYIFDEFDPYRGSSMTPKTRKKKKRR